MVPDPVLRVRRDRLAIKQQLGVGFVIAEKQFWRAVVGARPGQQVEIANKWMLHADPRPGRLWLLIRAHGG
jgi:hypothetical protein